MHLCVHNSSISVPLHIFSSKSRVVLRVAEVTFRDHKAHTRTLILHLRLPKDSRKSLLRTSREHTMESPSSLGSLSIMYQEREGRFEFSYKRPPRDEQYGNTLLSWPKFSQEIPRVCDPEQRYRGLSCWPSNNSSQPQQREGDFAPRQLRSKDILASGLGTPQF